MPIPQVGNKELFEELEFNYLHAIKNGLIDHLSVEDLHSPFEYCCKKYLIVGYRLGKNPKFPFVIQTVENFKAGNYIAETAPLNIIFKLAKFKT